MRLKKQKKNVEHFGIPQQFVTFATSKETFQNLGLFTDIETIYTLFI